MRFLVRSSILLAWVPAAFGQLVVSDGTESEALVNTPVSQTVQQAWGFTCNGTYSVFAYGAAGNGVTDDTKAIQSALNAAAGTGGCVTFGSGHTFLISSRLVVPHGVRLTPVAGGNDSTIKMSRSATGQVVLYIADNNPGDIVINHLILDANGVYGGITIAPGVSASPPTGITIQHVTIKNTGAWDGNPQSVAAIYVRNARNLVIQSCLFDTTGNVRFGPCQNCQLLNSTFQNTYTGNSVSLNFSGESRSWTFGEGFVMSGNIFRDVCRMAAELFNNLPGATITNNRVESYNPNCSGVSERYGFSLVGGGANNALVAGNYLNGTSGGGAYGIELGWSNSVWENNEIHGFNTGIVVQGQSGNIIRNNRIYRPRSYGILISNAGPDPNNRYENNYIENPKTGGFWVNVTPYYGSQFIGNTVVRNQSISGETEFHCFKLDDPQGAVSLINNTCRVTVNTPSPLYGISMWGSMSSSTFDGNQYLYCGSGNKGSGIHGGNGNWLTSATLRNNHVEGAVDEVSGGITSIGSKSGNTYYNVTNPDPGITGSTLGASRCGS